MPIQDLDEAQTDAKYAKAFRKDLKKAKTSNVPFMVFDKFKFKSGMKPMVLLGKFDPKDDTDSQLIDKIKERGVYKAEGLCKFDDEDLVFQIKKGRCTSKILQEACEAIGDDVTWRLKSEAPEVDTPEPVAMSEKDLKAEGTRLMAELKLLERYKRVTKNDDADADLVRRIKAGFEKLKALSTAKEYAEAVKQVRVVNDLIGEAETSLRHDRERAAQGAAGEVGEAAKGVETPEYKQAELTYAHIDTKIKDLTGRLGKRKKELGSLEQDLAKARDKKSRDKVGNQIRGLQRTMEGMQARVDTEMEDLKAAQEILDRPKAEIAKKIKAYETLQLVADGIIKKTDTAAKAIGTVTADPAIEEFVKEDAEAREWRDKEMEDPDKHGSGRHGAATGIDRQARRVASQKANKKSVPPDQKNNPSGSTTYTKQWRRTTLKIEDLPNGQKKIHNKGDLENFLEKFTLSGVGNEASMFMSPKAEKFAVDVALKIANNQLKQFDQYKAGSNWKNLDQVNIVVERKEGFGNVIQRDAGASIMTIQEVDREMTRFEEGTIDLDTLLEKLETGTLKDETGGTAIVKFAEVRLRRRDLTADFDNVTQFPCTANAKSWTVSGKTVKQPDSTEATLGAVYANP